MRKLIYGINLTADGCCDHTKGKGGEDIHYYFADLYRDVDLIVYGRTTYELMVPFWPDMARDQTGPDSVVAFAKAFDAIDKLVFSRTLEQAGARTTILRENPIEEIARLKRQPGKNISLGGVDLASQLVAAGLVDEFHFVIHPVIAGAGRRLFDQMPLPEQLNLKLAESRLLPSGSMALHYLKQ